jgi:Ctr copper transporter family
LVAGVIIAIFVLVYIYSGPSVRQYCDHMHLVARLSLLLTFLVARALAHDNGMVMSTNQGMSVNMGNMIAYLHFTMGDNLWFIGWAPRSLGAMIGTCIGLFILAVAERWLAVRQAIMEAHWSTRFDIRLSSPMLCSCTGYAVPRFLSQTISIRLSWRHLLKSVTSCCLRLHSLGVTHQDARPLPLF